MPNVEIIATTPKTLPMIAAGKYSRTRIAYSGIAPPYEKPNSIDAV